MPLQRGSIKVTLQFHAGLSWHRARFHGLRLVFCVIAIIVWWVVGLVRLAALILFFVWIVSRLLWPYRSCPRCVPHRPQPWRQRAVAR